MSLRSLSAVLAASCSLVAAAAAQTLVLPQSHAASEGTTATNVPFGRGTPARVQCVYDAALFAGPGTITAIAFRLDGGATAAGKQVDCEVRMSTSPRGLVDTNAQFAANRGADETVVLPRGLLQLPAQTAVATPSPLLPPIALQTPFAYDPALGALVVEVVVHGQPPGSYTLDATFVCDSPEAATGPAACAPGAVQPLRVASATTQVLWGRPWVSQVLDAPPGAFVALVLGSRDSGPWSGWMLPQDLAALGAPGCFLTIDMGAVLFQNALGDGSATFTVAIPSLPSTVGTWLYFQGGAFVAGVNALGLITSQARKVQVCGFEPVARVWAGNVTDPVGVLELGTAPVVELAIQ